MVATKRPDRARGDISDYPTTLLAPVCRHGAADDDPSGIATYSQASAQFGFSLTCTMLLTLPFTAAIQIVSACIGWRECRTRP